MSLGHQHPLRLRLAALVGRILPPAIAPSITRRIYSLEDGRRTDLICEAKALTGSPLLGRTSDVHFYRFCIHGYFDWGILAVATAVCRYGESVVEVGANIGTETIPLSDIIGPGGKVWGFEPFAANLSELRRSLIHGGVANVEVIKAAVADTCGMFHFSPPPGQQSGMGYLVSMAGDGPAEASDVDTVTLDSLAARLTGVRLLVIDVEGWEPAVIRGAKNWIAESRPVIILEASESHLKRSNSSLSLLKEQLGQLGYRVDSIVRTGLRPVDTSAAASPVNWLGLHQSQIALRSQVHRAILRAGWSPAVRFINPLVRGRRGPSLRRWEG